MSQGERLARIETLLETLPAIRDELSAIRKDLDADKADLASLKNKGAGILIGVSLVFTAVGATVSALWKWAVG